MTPDEYNRYNAFKALGEFGKEMDMEEFRAARKRKLAWVRDVIAPFQKICDYGAGTGWFREMCEENGANCMEIDEIADKGAFSRIAPVDLVSTITVLEHMHPDEVMRFIDTAKTKCRYLFIATNNPRCAFSHFVLWDDITHVRMYSSDSIRALLRAKGWEIERAFFQDDILSFHEQTQREKFLAAAASFGPLALSSQYNYWCLMARNPEPPEGVVST